MSGDIVGLRGRHTVTMRPSKSLVIIFVSLVDNVVT